MKLYLARHGDAGPPVGDDDRTRPLTELGRAECAQVSLFLGTSGLVVNRIHHSAYARTQETAEIYARSLSDTLRLEPLDVIGPEKPIEPVLDFLAEEEEDTLLVGHFPQFTRLASKLLECSPLPFTFDTGSFVCLEPRGGPNGARSIAWFIRPDLLGRSHLLTRT